LAFCLVKCYLTGNIVDVKTSLEARCDCIKTISVSASKHKDCSRAQNDQQQQQPPKDTKKWLKTERRKPLLEA